MSFGQNPVTTTQTTLVQNQIPVGSVAVPNAVNGDLTALEGGPASIDANGNKTAPVSIYGKAGTLVDGADITQGTKGDAAATDSTSSWSVVALLKGILAKLLSSIAVSQSGTWSVTATQTTASNLNAQAQGAAASGASNSGNPVKIGGAFNSTQPTVTNGQVVDGQMTSRGAQIVATGTDTFNVTVNTALPAGSATIGAVTQASGPWTQNITQVNGSALANTNPVPSQDIEQSGYVSASSPPSATNAGSDTSYTFSSQISRVIVQNNTSANVNYAFDTAASAGSLLLVPGATLIYPKKCTVLHLYTVAAQNVNGSTAGNIVVLGAL